MSTPATSTQETKKIRFPNEETIQKFASEHRLAKTGEEVDAYAKITFATIAKHFADREIPHNDLQKEIKRVLAAEMGKITDYANDHERKLYQGDKAILDLIGKGHVMWEANLSLAMGAKLKAYENLLNDLARK